MPWSNKKRLFWQSSSLATRLAKNHRKNTNKSQFQVWNRFKERLLNRHSTDGQGKSMQAAAMYTSLQLFTMIEQRNGLPIVRFIVWTSSINDTSISQHNALHMLFSHLMTSDFMNKKPMFRFSDERNILWMCAPQRIGTWQIYQSRNIKNS